MPVGTEGQIDVTESSTLTFLLSFSHPRGHTPGGGSNRDRRRPPPPAARFLPPSHVRKGDRAPCLFRRCRVIITSWTEAPIPWPRCITWGSHGGGSGLLVTGELVRAIRRESAEAIMHWWGVSHGPVARWRKALGADRVNNRETNRLIRQSSAKGVRAARRRGVTAAERRRRSMTGRSLDFIRNARAGRNFWTPAELALLGTRPDADVASRTERTKNAVRQKRGKLGITNPFDGRRTR